MFLPLLHVPAPSLCDEVLGVIWEICLRLCYFELDGLGVFTRFEKLLDAGGLSFLLHLIDWEYFSISVSIKMLNEVYMKDLSCNSFFPFYCVCGVDITFC